MMTDAQLENFEGHTQDWEKTGSTARWSDFTVWMLVAEVRRLRGELASARKSAKAWKAKALEYRNAGASEKQSPSGTPYIPSSPKEEKATRAQRYDRLLRTLDALDADENECDALRSRVEELQNAINEYCRGRNQYLVDCFSYDPMNEAIDRLYELSRESGFRPRYVADSETAK